MEYAQARIQARYGAHPGEASWRELAGHRDFAAYLAAARALPLAPWLAGIDEAAGPHEIERALRRRWREHVAEVASWLPPEWRPAARWVARLVDLPALLHLARGGALPPGFDPDLGRRASVPAAADAALDAWQAQWMRLWPAAAEAERQDLAALARRVRTHAAAFAALDPERAGEARRAFRERSARAFRAAAMRPAAAFLFLLIDALDLERLRGELIARALLRRPVP